MMPSFPRLILAVFAFAIPLAFAHAQSGQPNPAKLRFLFLDETPGAYSLKLGTTFRQVSSTPYAISQPFQPPTAAPLEVYKTSTVPDPATGVKPRIKVAVVTPPANTSAALVVIAPQPGSDTAGAPPTYSVRFFDNDPNSFPPKSLRILNLGHNQMAAQFGTERALVDPGTFKILRPATDKYNRVVGKVAVSTPPDWKLLYNKMLIIGPEERLTGVFVYSPSGLRHTYTALELAEMGPPPPGHFWLSYTDTP